MNISNSFLNNKYGCWIVNGIPFDTKLSALHFSSQIGSTPVSFYYHDHVWQNFDRSILGKISLSDLYKQRALQLRDRYDYLILHYSGGSDSHNILYTFLKNNIKLDEISVRWIKPLRDQKFYTPNRKDTSGRNAASEWDFTIKPTLDWLKLNKPEIKINLVDYANNLTDNMISPEACEKRILEMNIAKGGLGYFSMMVNPEFEYQISENENAGHIFGVEKPMLFIKGNDVYFQFMDTLFEVGILPDGKPAGRSEMFYWAPDFPLLTIEQAYQTALYFKNNYSLGKWLWNDDPTISQEEMMQKFQEQGNIHKKILYSDSWDFNKFQVGKPNLMRSDWYFWLYEHPEMSTLRRNWEISMKNIVAGIDKRLVITEGEGNILRPIRTRPFHILSLKNK
jgi:hypothetical protein